MSDFAESIDKVAASPLSLLLDRLGISAAAFFSLRFRLAGLLFLMTLVSGCGMQMDDASRPMSSIALKFSWIRASLLRSYSLVAESAAEAWCKRMSSSHLASTAFAAALTRFRPRTQVKKSFLRICGENGEVIYIYIEMYMNFMV